MYWERQDIDNLHEDDEDEAGDSAIRIGRAVSTPIGIFDVDDVLLALIPLLSNFF